MRERGYSGRGGGAFWEVLGWRFVGRGDSFLGGKSGPETRGRQGDIFSGGVLRVKLEKNQEVKLVRGRLSFLEWLQS